MLVSDIKPLHCQRIVNMQAGKSKTQINEVYNALRFFFRYAVANELIIKDPTSHLTKPVGTRGKRRALTAKERQAFIEIGKTDRRYYFYLLMIFCGCRLSEAAECMGRDIIFDDGYYLLHIRGTKTANADRFVPIPDNSRIDKKHPKNGIYRLLRER